MIYKERIRQARELKRLTQAQMAKAIGVAQPMIAHLEAGLRGSTPDVFEAIARETSMPPAFFEREPVTAFPMGSLVYRARVAATAGERKQAYQYVTLLVEQMQLMATRLTIPPLELPAAENPVQAARLTREAFGIAPLRTVPHIINALERHGVIVFSLPFKLDKIDAFSSWATIDCERPIITLSSSCPGDRIRFSAAHELGHLVIHKGLHGATQALEREANQFAAEFLLPEQPMREILSERFDLALAALLKPRWKVSMQMLVRRARDLGIITERHYRSLFAQIGQNGWRKAEPGHLPIERPRLYRQMAEMLYSPETALGLADEFGIGVVLAQELLNQYAPFIKSNRFLETAEPYQVGDWEHRN